MPTGGDLRRIGVLALAGFFVFGTLMSGLSFLALIFPSSPLKSIWRLNPEAHADFLLLGWWAVLLMAVVSVGCAFAALGLFRYRGWGYRLALGILAANAVGDLLGAILRSDSRTLMGVPIVALLIVFLTRREVRGMFK